MEKFNNYIHETINSAELTGIELLRIGNYLDKLTIEELIELVNYLYNNYENLSKMEKLVEKLADFYNICGKNIYLDISNRLFRKCN